MLSRVKCATALLILATAMLAFAENPVRVIEVPGAPLEIVEYEARYQEDGRYVTEGVRHRVIVRNPGNQAVVALGIGFYAFDAFNRYMGRPLTGISMRTLDAGDTSDGMVWVQRPSASFTFREYGTGVAFVRIARLSDGTIWDADMDYVLQRLQELEDGLTLEDIDERD